MMRHGQPHNNTHCPRPGPMFSRNSCVASMPVATSFPQDMANIVKTFERLKLVDTRLCLTRHIINRERLLCKGRDEILLAFQPPSSCRLPSGQKASVKQSSQRRYIQTNGSFLPKLHVSALSSIRQNRSHANDNFEIHSLTSDRGQMIATRTRIRAAMCGCTQASGYSQSTDHLVHQDRI